MQDQKQSQDQQPSASADWGLKGHERMRQTNTRVVDQVWYI